jgi:hypothetical protein
MGFLLYLAFGYSTWSTWEEIGSGFFKFGTLPVHGTTESGHAATANWFSYLFSGKEFPALELSMISTITAMAAIAGNGGLTNAPISNYTRDQGWGMGKEVGAIPSIIGGQSIKLSHVGKVFEPNEKSLPRWRGWMRHIQREQLLVWMPACFMGMALPSMLSVQFLPRGVVPANKWLAAGMTASGVSEAVGPKFGPLFWHLTLFCGFLVLATSAVTTSEGCLRRWVDVVWTASPRVRKWDTRDIGRFYFVVLCVYAAFGLIMLNFTKGDRLLVWATNIYNYALGISCFHVVVVNTMLLPRELKPHWLRRAALIAAGTFFMTIAVLTTMDTFGLLAPKKPDSAPAAVEPAPPAPAATPAK